MLRVRAFACVRACVRLHAFACVSIRARARVSVRACVCVCGRAHARVCIHTWVSCCRGNALSFAGWSALGRWLGGATLLGSLNGFDVAQLRRGGMTALEMANMEGLPAAVALAGLLQPSAATLTSVDLRRRHTDKHAHSYTRGA